MTFDSGFSNAARGEVPCATGRDGTPGCRPGAEYPLVGAAGSSRDLGRQHGEQAADKIKAHVELIAAQGQLSRSELHFRALTFEPLFDQHCAHLLEEIHGLAEGAQIPLAEALAVNIRGELSHAPREGCTTFAVGKSATADHQVLAGQNCDVGPHLQALGYVLHLKPAQKPEVLMWTFGGMIGYHGMNSLGVAHFANALFGDGPATRWAMPHYPLKRLMLECGDVEQVVELCRMYPVASNGNYMLCDGQGNILDVEVTTAGPEVLTDNQAGFLAHSNHFVCSRYPQKGDFPEKWKDSFPRLERMNSLIKARYGSLTLDDLKGFLSDHAGSPTSICRHEADTSTAASLIAEPAERRMHVAYGNPCENPYVSYCM